MEKVRIQEADFEPGQELARLTSGRSDIGAVVSFMGLVRDMQSQDAGPDKLSGRLSAQPSILTLEHYPAMTEQVIEQIITQAQDLWPINDALVIHRVGKLLPSDRIVLVAVASVHRGAAFQACEYIIDFLKTNAPFWKKEATCAGARWVEAKRSDREKSDGWLDRQKKETR